VTIQTKLKEMRERCEAAQRPTLIDNYVYVLASQSDVPALISALEVCLGALSKIAFCEIIVNDIEYKTFNDAFINMADHSAKEAIAKAEAILS